MIPGFVFPLAALIPATLIVRERAEHVPFAIVLALGVLHALAQEHQAPEHIQVLLAVLALTASLYAYLSAWSPGYRIAAAGPLSLCWNYTMSLLCSVVAGALAFVVGMRARHVHLTITQTCLVAMLLGDATGLALIRTAPDALYYQGRTEAAVLALTQIGWLVVRRRGSSAGTR